MVFNTQTKFVKINNVDEMLAVGNQLKIHPHPKVRNIGEKIVNTFGSDIDDSSLGTAILDIIGKIVSFLPIALGGIVLSAGITVSVIILLLSVLSACLFFILGAGAQVVISPTYRKKFFKKIKTDKDSLKKLK